MSESPAVSDVATLTTIYNKLSFGGSENDIDPTNAFITKTPCLQKLKQEAPIHCIEGFCQIYLKDQDREMMYLHTVDELLCNNNVIDDTSALNECRLSCIY